MTNSHSEDATMTKIDGVAEVTIESRIVVVVVVW